MKKTLKNILLWLTSAFTFLCVLAGVALAPKTASAAETATWQTGSVFEMDDGVSLKLGNVGGMRFIVRMDETVHTFLQENEDAELGFVIAPKNLMLAANGDYLNMPLKIGGAADKDKMYQEGGYYFANGCITDVKYANLTRSFAAVAYISYNGEVRYTEYNDLARNNLYDAVNIAALSGNYPELFTERAGGYIQGEEGEGWYGSEQFPIVVETNAEYDALVDLVNANAEVDFSKYHAVIENGASTSKQFTENAPIIKAADVDELNKLIVALPNSISMPDAIGMIGRIREAEKNYNALSEEKKAEVVNYAKVEGLLTAIKGYDRVYKNDADDGTVIPSHVPNYTSTVGGSATTRMDDVYGNVLTVASAADGKAALHFQSFPSIEKYAKIYFYVKVSVACKLYLSDGITNDGWGENWKNNWFLDGYECNANIWTLVEINPADGYIGTDFALGFRADDPGFTFEISDFYGIVKELAGIDVATGLTFGQMTDTGTTNEYGKVYNIIQEQWFIDNNKANTLGSLPTNRLADNLPAGHDSYYFWMYNPTDTAYTFHLAGSATAGWTDSKDFIALTPKAWTKVTISAEDIELNKQGQWYIYIQGGNGDGATKEGWQISTIYAAEEVVYEKQEVALSFGQMTDTGATNEYGNVYNISREQWYIETNNMNTIGTLQTSKLANALPEGYEYFYFWMYNPTDTAYTFHLAGDCSGTWTDSADSFTLTARAWTEITISAADVALNTQGQWYVYILGGDGQGAAADGWQISTIYAGPDKLVEFEHVYYDHANVKEVIALINAIPEAVTLADKAAVEAARAAYEKLMADERAKITNYSKLESAEAVLVDMQAADEVIKMINAINANAPDLDEVAAARAAYEELSDGVKAYVTNLAVLEGYEALVREELELQVAVENVISMVDVLPDSVTMPDHLVFVSRIEAAKNAYLALSNEGKAKVSNYGKLRRLLLAINGYETIYVQTVDGVDVIPAYLPGDGYASNIGGGTASLGYDGYYGNYLIVTPGAGGRAAIQFKNFPDVSKYTKLYFNIRVVGASCDIYASDGITNGGWGDDWNNTWSLSGYWVNDGSWIQKEFNLLGTYESGGNTKYIKNIFSSNWALALRTANENVSFEITDIIGVKADDATGLTFGQMTDTGTTNEYGKVYNIIQEQWFIDNNNANTLGSLPTNRLAYKLPAGHDFFYFWMYNPTDTEYNFHLAGDCNGTWTDSKDFIALTPKAWTKVTISAEDIELNKQGQWYIYIQGGNGDGATKEGWQISAIYSSSTGDIIDKVQIAIDNLDTENIDEAAVTAARKAYEALNENEKELVLITNLIACETALYGDVANAAFIVDGVSDYKIYCEKDSKTAATFMKTRLAEATGAELALVDVEPSTITKYRYAIVLGYESLYAQLGLSVPTEEELGRAGYQIVKLGRAVFVFAYSADGYRMGVLEFLSQTVGYDMIAEDCIVYEASKAATLPEFNTESSSFDYRQRQTYMTADEVYGMGLQTNMDIWIPSEEGWDMHNTLHYLPTATYQSAHPNWYYTYTDSNKVSRTQICPTAKGSSTEFNAMVETIAANMLVQINAYPYRENISFSIMDTADGDDCQCARCKLYDKLYGEGGFAAAWIDLMNAVNAKIRETLPQDRVLNIAFLAYRGTEKAPANIDANGNVTLLKRYQISDNGSYTQTNEDLKCDDGVTVWLAPINGAFAENLNHTDNAETLATVKKWCAISDSVYVWLYGTNFKYYMYPYNTWQASAENYKLLKELGVKAVWSQSNETEMTAFTDLKGYIDSKFMADVNADYETVLNTYFDNYYGAASAKMRTMFNTIVAKCEALEAEYDGLGRGIYDEIESYKKWLTTSYYWTQDEVKALVALCDEAKALIDADGSLTDEQKTAFKNRITKESLFPRYVLCTSYASKCSSSEKNAMRQAFKADATALGLTLYKESDGELSSLYSSWGV